MKHKGKILQKILILSVFILPGSVFVFPQDKTGKNQTVRIGLLIQDSSYFAARNGAELAIIEANEKTGLSGPKTELVTKSMEGPWGTGSKQAVDLIFGQKVWGLIGAHDGRNAHLVEQAATKSRIVLISAWAGDPTLTQAFVPWFFNCVPNDNQQAAAISRQILAKKTGAVVISDETYDSKSLVKSLLYYIQKEGGKDPEIINIDKDASSFDRLKSIEAGKYADEIIVFCGPENTRKLAAFINENRLSLPVITTHYSLNENIKGWESDVFIKITSLASFSWNIEKYNSFRIKYRERYGSDPGFAASYAYDAACLLTEAIRKAGSSEREEIQKALMSIDFRGVTGRIVFDERGNRKGQNELSGLPDMLPSLR